MNNIEKLKELGILGAVRQRLGADNEEDETVDYRINKLDNSKLIELWSGWKLGDGYWWRTMKYYYDELEVLTSKTAK